MSTELTKSFTHRKLPSDSMYLEEQFGHVQLVLEREGVPGYVFRLLDADALTLANAINLWLVGKYQVPMYHATE